MTQVTVNLTTDTSTACLKIAPTLAQSNSCTMNHDRVLVGTMLVAEERVHPGHFARRLRPYQFWHCRADVNRLDSSTPVFAYSLQFVA